VPQVRKLQACELETCATQVGLMQVCLMQAGTHAGRRE